PARPGAPGPPAPAHPDPLAPSEPSTPPRRWGPPYDQKFVVSPHPARPPPPARPPRPALPGPPAGPCTRPARPGRPRTRPHRPTPPPPPSHLPDRACALRGRLYSLRHAEPLVYLCDVGSGGAGDRVASPPLQSRQGQSRCSALRHFPAGAENRVRPYPGQDP